MRIKTHCTRHRPPRYVLLVAAYSPCSCVPLAVSVPTVLSEVSLVCPQADNSVLTQFKGGLLQEGCDQLIGFNSKQCNFAC